MDTDELEVVNAEPVDDTLRWFNMAGSYAGALVAATSPLEARKYVDDDIMTAGHGPWSVFDFDTVDRPPPGPPTAPGLYYWMAA